MAAMTPVTDLEHLLDEEAASEVLGVSPRTMQDWRWRGGGPEYVQVGRRVKYAPSGLRDYIARRTRRSTSQGAARAATG